MTLESFTIRTFPRLMDAQVLTIPWFLAIRGQQIKNRWNQIKRQYIKAFGAYPGMQGRHVLLPYSYVRPRMEDAIMQVARRGAREMDGVGDLFV